MSFPFHRLFPHNSCEGTSCLLAYVLEETFGHAGVVVVEGRDPKTDDRHVWVETGGRVYDLTADQFEGFAPVYGQIGSPLADRFPEREVVSYRRYAGRDEAQALLNAALGRPERGSPVS